ncbi:MAG: sulfatase [Deltaproteobacteria bacterium]|nr:MAG: sulfatase [Deltaproteobacteria bacterium]
MGQIGRLLGALLCGAGFACAERAGEPVEVPLTELASQAPGAARVEGEGELRRLVQPAGESIDLYLRLPRASRLHFEMVPELPSQAFAIHVATDADRQTLEPERAGANRWDADLSELAGRAVRLTLENRSGGPIGWIRPRVAGRARARPAALGASARPPDPPINVILYVVDTLRLDRMSVYGYARPTTPELARWAERGALFRSAYAPGSKTPPTITALFASRHPDELGARLRPDGPAPHTLAERFREAGYATAAFQANFTLRPALGYARGFDEYRILKRTDSGKPRKVDAAELHAHVLAWLRERGEQPFFAYVQSMDVHYPYAPPDAFRARFAPRDAGDAPKPPAPDAPPDAQLATWYLPNLYDASVAYADHEIGALLDALAALPFAHRTAVVITSDHGEPLGQRGDVYHGHSLYEELVHVPLLVLLPWRREPVRVEEIVSLQDLAPTLLDLAGLAVPDAYAGRSLLRPPDLLEPPSAVGSKDAEAWYIREGRWKLLLDDAGARLFDLRADPHELRDVSAQHPVTAGYLTARLMRRTPAFLDTWEAPGPMDSGLDAEERASLEEALRALGYIE